MAPPELVTVLDDQRTPLDTGELVAALATISVSNPDLAAVLDHLCIRAEAVAAFLDEIRPTIAGLSAVGESLAVGGIGGLMGIMSAGSPRAD